MSWVSSRIVMLYIGAGVYRDCKGTLLPMLLEALSFPRPCRVAEPPKPNPNSLKSPKQGFRSVKIKGVVGS